MHRQERVHHFNRACDHIANYSNGHETLAKTIGTARFNYPENHIEVDNRLSWFFGTLDRLYGRNAYYVYLIRNPRGHAAELEQALEKPAREHHAGLCPSGLDAAPQAPDR